MDERTIAILNYMYDYYTRYDKDTGMPIDLAVEACEAFNLYRTHSYRVPAWVHMAAKMVMALKEGE